MIRLSYNLEIITPCFCAGADPQKQAEIRAASIRGQLRWWFRVLGGFQSLAPMRLREQEDLIFGSAAGNKGRAGQLALRVREISLEKAVRDGQQLGHRNFSPSAFLTFPIQSREQQRQVTQYAGRGCILSGHFELHLLWRGARRHQKDLEALVGVFANLGSLGFRGRRAMGALRLENPALSIPTCLEAFGAGDSITVKAIPCTSSSDAIAKLGGWLKRCRAHGRSGKNSDEQRSPYFEFAKRDHDIGYRTAGNAAAFRPPLGLPIIQRTRNGTNHWEWDPHGGRFASPVILRPHKDANRKWHGLVIFVEAKRWPDGKQVFLNGEPRSVSLDLYDKMKADQTLMPFG